VISGEGARFSGVRFVPVGVRAVYASLEEETALREVTSRKIALGSRKQISVGEYPRMTYVLSVATQRNLDLAVTPSDALCKDQKVRPRENNPPTSPQGGFLALKSINQLPRRGLGVGEARFTADCTDPVPMGVFRVPVGNLGPFGIYNLHIQNSLWLSWFESMPGSHSIALTILALRATDVPSCTYCPTLRKCVGAQFE
jgi:hypothetical protein